MSKAKSINIIERGSSPFETIMLLAWPIILEQVMLTMVQYVDTAMVGSLGAAATAAVAINQPSVNLINGIMMSCGVAFTALVARAIGADNLDRAKKVVAQAVLMTLLLGTLSTLIMSVLSPLLPVWMGGEPEILPDAKAYMLIISLSMLFKAGTVIFGGISRGAGDTKTPLKINTIVNIINVIGNFLLIYPTREISIAGLRFTMYGAGLGVAGAAIATSFSIVVGGILMCYIIFVKDSHFRLHKGTSFAPDREILGLAFKIGLPAAGERFAMSTAQIMVTTIIAGLGTVSLAAHHLSITAESICFMPAFGFASAATTLIGQTLGAKREDLTDSLSFSCIKIAITFMSVMGVVLFVLSKFLIGIFTPDPEVIELGSRCLKIIAFSQPFFAVSMTITGILRGAGDTKWPFYIILVSMWGIRVGLAYVLVVQMGLGLTALWVCMALDFATRSVLFSLRYRTGHWKYVIAHH